LRNVPASLALAGCLVALACAGPSQSLRTPPRETVPDWETPPIPESMRPLVKVMPLPEPTRPTPPPRGRVEAQPLEDDPSVRILSFTTPRGQPVTLRYKQKSRSVGRTNRGHLEDGRCLPNQGPGFVHPGDAACGTDETVTLVLFAIGEVMRDYPDTVPIVVGALSMPTGGKLRPHKSHRSGRDIDFGFFRTGNEALHHFEDIAADRIDFDKSFLLMANLIATGRVQNIFVNYALQSRLHQAARDMGYDDAQLSWLFEYPRGRKAQAGVIRHAKGHTRHFHVRFVCPTGDSTCDEL
jgi:YD repeat-containing protein